MFLIRSFVSSNAPINVMPAWGGGGGRAWGGDLIVFVDLGVGHLTDLLLPGEDLNLSSLDMEIFDCRLGRKRLRPNICFPLPRFTHAPYGLKRSGIHGGQ